MDLILPEPELKPAVCPFRIIADNREQAPYHFTGITDDKTGQPLIVNLITDRALKSGDYSIEGYESEVSVERKSHIDFLGSIGGERERFEREIARLNEMQFAAVVIEASWEKILLDPPSQSRITPKVASRTIASWSIRYPRVHWFPCMNRRHAELWTFQLLSMFYRQQQHVQAEAAEENKTQGLSENSGTK